MFTEYGEEAFGVSGPRIEDMVEDDSIGRAIKIKYHKQYYLKWQICPIPYRACDNRTQRDNYSAGLVHTTSGIGNSIERLFIDESQYSWRVLVIIGTDVRTILAICG